MKNTFLLLVFLIFSTLSWAQLEINYDIHFTHSQEEYQSLEEFTNLTEDLGAWDYSDFDFDPMMLAVPFVMPGFENRPMEYFEVGAHGGLLLAYDNWPDDPYSIYLEGIAMDAFLLSPLNDSTNSDQGHILFHEGNGLLQVEFQNVALEEELFIGDGSLVSRANFQIEVDYEDLCVQFHYGPSDLSPELQEFFEDEAIVGTLFGWFFEEEVNGELMEDWLDLVGIVSGDPNMPDIQQLFDDPDFDGEGVEYLNSFPEEGTVYRFCYTQTTSVDDLLSKDSDLTVYPNPAANTIRLEGSFGDEPKSVIILDHLGRTVLRTQSGGDIDITELPAGVYVVGVHYGEEEGYRYGKVVVE